MKDLMAPSQEVIEVEVDKSGLVAYQMDLILKKVMLFNSLSEANHDNVTPATEEMYNQQKSI